MYKLYSIKFGGIDKMINKKFKTIDDAKSAFDKRYNTNRLKWYPYYNNTVILSDDKSGQNIIKSILINEQWHDL